MKKLKINLDRQPLESKYIESKQNFDQVLNGFKQLKPPIWKNPWFYGPVGVATVALMLTVGSINSNTNADEKTTTLNASNQLPEDTKCIHPPVANLDEKFATYQIDPSKEQTVILPSGTSIFIPKGSLSPSSNDKPVELKIREFENKAEAFVAGIPMNYKENEAFESAGMIEIRGVQGDKEVAISKPIEVSMVLSKDPANFSFWQLNEETKTWKDYPANYSSGVTSQKGPQSLSSAKALEHEIVKIDEKISENEVQVKKNTEPSRLVYNLPIDKNQRFDLDFDTHEFPELEKFSGMEFEVVSSKAYDRTFTKKTWSSVDLTKENDLYYATFSSKSDKFKIAVRPVLTGKKKEETEVIFGNSLSFYQKKKVELEEEAKALKIQKQHQQEKYEKLLVSFNKAQEVKQQEELAADSKVQKVEASLSEVAFKADFSIKNFGVFNCDKPITYPEALASEVVFSFGHAPIEIASAHVFDEKKDARFSFGASSGHQLSDFGCFDKNPNTLVVVDKTGRLGYVLSFNSSKVQNGIVKMTMVDKNDVNVDFIQKLLNEKTANS